MMRRTTELTEFGKAVNRFVFETGIPRTVIASECGVSYETLRSTMFGRIPGREVVPKVEAYMEQFYVLENTTDITV